MITMASYTSKDLRRQLAIIDSIRKGLGIDPELTYGLEEGSKTYGRTFKLYGLREGSTGHYSISIMQNGFGSIGWTKKEAFGILVAIKYALEAAAAAQGIEWTYPDLDSL
jgi:hypothetical protein